MSNEFDFCQEALLLAEAIYQRKKQDEQEALNPTKLQAIHRYYKSIWGSNGFNIFEAQKFYTQDQVAQHGYCTFIDGIHYQCYDKFDPMTGNLHLCKNHKEEMDEKKQDVIIALVREFSKKNLQQSAPLVNKKKSFSFFGRKS